MPTGLERREQETGVLRIVGTPFTTWLVETDVMAARGQPILSLVSRVFLRDHERIIDMLSRSGHDSLLYYTLQQIQQFRNLGEDFAMQHKDSEYMGKLEEELQTAVLEAIPIEKRVQGLSAEDRVRGLSPEEVLQRFTPEEVLQRFTPEELAAGLSKEQAARLRELLKPKQGT